MELQSPIINTRSKKELAIDNDLIVIKETINSLPPSGNFADTDLTFTGDRSHNTAGNDLQITTDNGLFGQSFFYMTPTLTDIGTANAYVAFGTRIDFRSNPTGTVQRIAPTGVSIGFGGADAQARLDVRAQGALSTDVAFRVRNSADTYDMYSFFGNGTTTNLLNSTGPFTLVNGYNLAANNADSMFQAYMTNSANNAKAGFLAQTAGAGYTMLFQDYGTGGGGGSSSGNLWHNTGSGSSYFNFASLGSNANGFRFIKNTGTTIDGTQGKLFQIASSAATWYQSVISIGTYCGASQSAGPVLGYGGNTLFIANGTAPTLTDTDSFGMYSADIIAGNAAPHFRTENGAIIKLYQETTGVAAAAFVSNTSLIVDDSATYGGYTMGQVVAALKAQGLLA